MEFFNFQPFLSLLRWVKQNTTKSTILHSVARMTITRDSLGDMIVEVSCIHCMARDFSPFLNKVVKRGFHQTKDLFTRLHLFSLV